MMTDRDYAIKSMKEITFRWQVMTGYLEVTIERHYTDIKAMMTSIRNDFENQIVLENWIWNAGENNEDMAYD